MKQTKNYGMFKISPHNRKIRERKVRELARSIKEVNLLEQYPILVSQDMIVQDGQHRLAAAKVLGVPIFYNTVDLADVMVLLNSHQDRWTLEDYTNHWVSKGIPDYILYMELRNKYPFVPKTSLIRLLCNNPKSKYLQGSGRHLFYKGTFKVINEEATVKVIEMVRDIEPFLMDGVVADRVFWFSFFRLSKHRDFNFERFFERLKVAGTKINIFATPREYYRAFEDIYNWHIRGTPTRFY